MIGCNDDLGADVICSVNDRCNDFVVERLDRCDLRDRALRMGCFVWACVMDEDPWGGAVSDARQHFVDVGQDGRADEFRDATACR